jgi:hypothetical protein
LALRGTALEELPLGLLASLPPVSQLTLDLRDNRLTSLSPDTFYYNLTTTWENLGTKLISGKSLSEYLYYCYIRNNSSSSKH